MNKLDAIVFDFDGTLAELTLDFDLMKTRIAALGEVFLEERPTPGAMPALEWLEQLVGEAMEWDEAEGKEFRTRGNLVITAMEMDAAREGKLFEFTRPGLTMLRERGVGAGIITRNISAAVRLVFPDLDDYVQTLIARECATRVKPDPAHLHQALEGLGAMPQRSLMVGDHPMDIETGRAAGALCAAVTSGHVNAEGFRSVAPDYIATDVAELLGLLESDGLL